MTLFRRRASIERAPSREDQVIKAIAVLAPDGNPVHADDVMREIGRDAMSFGYSHVATMLEQQGLVEHVHLADGTGGDRLTPDGWVRFREL
jgi:hypothetical protein